MKTFAYLRKREAGVIDTAEMDAQREPEYLINTDSGVPVVIDRNTVKPMGPAEIDGELVVVGSAAVAMAEALRQAGYRAMSLWDPRARA